MTYTTQCPNCQTRFKVNDAQLAAANGLVRCGRCSHVFNATEHFVAAEAPPAEPPRAVAPQPAVPQPAAQPREALDDFELEVPDFDPGASVAEAPPDELLMPPPMAEEAPAARADVEEFQRALAEAMQNRHVSAPLGNPFDAEPLAAAEPAPEVFGNRRRPAPEPEAEAAPAAIAEPKFEEPPARPMQEARVEPLSSHREDVPDESPRRRHPALTFLAVLASVIGVLVLAGQLVYFNRTRIAAEVPELRPTLESLCGAVGCAVPWPTDIARVRTEWSELAFVPDFPNLIQLSATLKNHATYSQAYPMLEVTLKDSDDQVLIRKVFAPKEYLKPDDFKLGHFNANSEVKVTMRLDAGKVHAMGYSLYWFYP
ncbi:DUF3426 domain-containing protein [Chromobacterium haemolyticum]|uniref:DUF3426 domain-containing protein n=1 Tax=Chromobacterium haemolyticum TaxID=394935 RepID=A0ABS3GQI7_9NEIS|nr:DUF3426 domain-containing protein [Chromobacterium haemolyticum]MBK0415999.1 DUF3426 domain-containing protein [Chromobacterium haemolyticum]MBO0416870.1 DUF3426 domain-containing protein [Chromobacterium haemolyticum]MBO0500386.1 DUF3426 domain-containing protein [Chromobacterium haemolyticum]